MITCIHINMVMRNVIAVACSSNLLLLLLLLLFSLLL
jgi:hypothetical protein